MVVDEGKPAISTALGVAAIGTKEIVLDGEIMELLKISTLYEQLPLEFGFVYQQRRSIEECEQQIQIKEVFSMSSREIVYKFVSLDPKSRSTPSKFRIKQVFFRKATSRSASQNYPTENNSQKFTNESHELRAVPCHMFRASGVQIPGNNLDNLSFTREEEDGTSIALDPHD
ncbi:hypothetical protein Tco_0129279 [Tanacetum coccineum]